MDEMTSLRTCKLIPEKIAASEGEPVAPKSARYYDSERLIWKMMQFPHSEPLPLLPALGLEE